MAHRKDILNNNNMIMMIEFSNSFLVPIPVFMILIIRKNKVSHF